jgi:hypothetical protein
MAWAVAVSPEFERWYTALSEAEQTSVEYAIRLLQELGPALGRPHADSVYGSRHSNMKELRAQHAGRAYRMFFAFDPDRVAIVLLGGTKNGQGRWYERMIASADDLFDAHLARRKSMKR